MSNFDHLVNTSNIKDNRNNLFYFDFEGEKWIKCSSVHSYPYNLFKYDLDGTDKSIITCSDSYRLIENLDNPPSIDEMYKEKEWREELVSPGVEVDMQLKGEWHKMRVAWTKSDIIKDVLHLQARDNPNKNNQLSGYYYKESTRLAKSSTHTRVIPQEELDKEKQEEEEFKIWKETQEKILTDLVKPLKVYNIKDTKHCFLDFFSYYKTLKIIHTTNLLDKKLFKTEEQYQEYVASSKYKRTIVDLSWYMGLSEEKYDGLSTIDEVEVKNGKFDLRDYDGFYNFKIHNATHAKLVSYDVEIEADVLEEFPDGKKTFGFKDITEDFPLFSGNLSYTNIVTDGDKISFNGLVLNTLARKIYILSNFHIYLPFKSRNFIFLHSVSFYSSSKVDSDRFVEIDEPPNGFYDWITK